MREFIVLSGELSWGKMVAAGYVTEDAVWLCGQKSETAPEAPCLSAAQGRKLLGASVGDVVLDAHAEFDPDLFALIAGSVNGGSKLVLLVPQLDGWAERHRPGAARFLDRLIANFRVSPAVVLVEQGHDVPDQASSAGEWVESSSAPDHPDCATLDQQSAVEGIIRVVSGHRRRPLVLLSDRGRGKSTALGIGAADLLRSDLQRIVVTAPRLSATDSLFATLTEHFPEGDHGRGICCLDGAEVVYFPPDHLLLHHEQADLLMVDEAAAIPAALLKKLLLRYSRIVFATTVHGYEGNGRGFAVRFREILDQEVPGWKQLQMDAPIRWANDDRLEKFVFDALLLKAEPVARESLSGLTVEGCQFVRVNRDHLVAMENQLAELFGLLVIAHYQTSANDLRQLLDDPDISIYAAIYNGKHIAATAVVVEESAIDPTIGVQIRQGKRRLKGHLAAQTLSAHLGIVEASLLNCRRIMRIATHPDFQSLGLGSALLEKIRKDAGAEQVDYLATSFGVTPDLLMFWKQAGFTTVKIGTRRNASSAAYSGLLLAPLSDSGTEMFARAQDRCAEIFPELLQEELAELEAKTAIALHRSSSVVSPTPGDRLALEEFADTRRSYISVLPELTRFALLLLTIGDANKPDHQLVVMKVLQKRSWSDCAQLFDLSGKARVMEQLRIALKNYLALTEPYE